MDTSNEARREVARQLEHYANDEMVGGSLLKTLKAVTGATSWRECLRVLAEMIERPTCNIVEDERGHSACSRCGADYLCMRDASYCPSCGAEVVEGER